MASIRTAKRTWCLAALILAFLMTYLAGLHFNEQVTTIFRDQQNSQILPCDKAGSVEKESTMTPLMDGRLQIPKMDKELAFLNPNIGWNCADLFAKPSARKEIQSVLDELDRYENRTNVERRKLISQGKRPSGEGYCSEDKENTYVMVKLAR